MTPVDQVKLKAAAEHLERVLKQHPGSDDVQSLLRALTPLIEDAKSGRISASVDRTGLPGAWHFGDGRYTTYENPSVDRAYSNFANEMGGGLSEEEKERIADLDAMWNAIDGRSTI